MTIINSYEDLLKKGVYCIKNIYNNKLYIGSTTRAFKYRLDQHLLLLRLNSHHSCHLQRSWNKYGENSFEYSILEFIEDNNIIINREQFWINKYDFKMLYNMSPTASSSLGIKRTPEQIEKMKKLKPSEEVKIKISNTLKKRYQEGLIPYKQQHKWKKVYQFNKQGELLGVFESPMAASKTLNLDFSHILDCCKKKKKYKSVGGFIFSFDSVCAPYKNNRLSPIKITNIFTNETLYFNSINEAVKLTSYPKGTLVKALLYARLMYKTYKIAYI